MVKLAVRMLVGGLLCVLAAGFPANAADETPGLSVAPARQALNDLDSITVTVGNTGDGPGRVHMTPMVYTTEGWQEGNPADLTLEPRSFRLGPHSQRTVHVWVGDPPKEPCIYLGVAATVQVAGGQLKILGQAISQLLLEGRGGTEADCAALLPNVTAPAAPVARDEPPYLLAVAAVVVVGSLGWRLVVGRKRQSKPKRKPGRHRPGYTPRRSAWSGN